jgi:hypothetical protein
VIPKSQNEVTHRLQYTRSIGIAISVLIMLTAIDFYNELSVGAKKVDYKSIDRHLSLEFRAAKSTIPQTEPKHTLGIRLIAT